MGNQTSQRLTQVDATTASIPTTLGALAFVENVTLLIFIARLVCNLRQPFEKSGVIIQMLFVCINDTLCGVLIFMLGLLRVGPENVSVCTYLVLITATVHIVSQGNIACICLQRYLAARNIRRNKNSNRKFNAIVLSIANIVLGVLSFVWFTMFSSVKDITEGNEVYCSLTNSLAGNKRLVFLSFFILSIVFTVTADILSVMTICKLKKELNAVIRPETRNVSVSAAGTISYYPGQAPSVKMRQRRALVTIMLILVFLNLTTWPVLAAYLISFWGMRLPVHDRILFLITYSNFLINPIIIATRTKDIRNTFVHYFEKLRCIVNIAK